MASSNNREIAENKITVLYTVDRANMPISNLQLTKIIMENRIMNFFILQHFITELCSNNYLLTEKKENQTFYTISPEGKELLGYFVGLIPKGIKKRIDDATYALKRSKKYETIIKADYTVQSENEFICTLSVSEGDFKLVGLSIAVGSKENAKAICSNWQKHSQEIYSEIIDSLTKVR